MSVVVTVNAILENAGQKPPRILVFILTWPRRHFDQLGSSPIVSHLHCTKEFDNRCNYSK